ncbi:MAG TPA: hypothetical protein VLA87_04595 [Gaiellaceae bacterium]|nr:hypothetical protein [Gaiellaceae bacterium]
MEPAHGRRLSRLALTLWIAVPALVAVMVGAIRRRHVPTSRSSR